MKQDHGRAELNTRALYSQYNIDFGSAHQSRIWDTLQVCLLALGRGTATHHPAGGSDGATDLNRLVPSTGAGATAVGISGRAG